MFLRVLLLLLLLVLLLSVLAMVIWLAFTMVPRPVPVIVTASTFASVPAASALILSVVAVLPTRRWGGWRGSIVIGYKGIGSSTRIMRIGLRISTSQLGILRVIVRLHRRSTPATSAIIVSASGSTTTTWERACLGLMPLATPLGRGAGRGRRSLIWRPVLLRIVVGGLLNLRVRIRLVTRMIGSGLRMLLRGPLWLRRRIAAGRGVLSSPCVSSRMGVGLSRILIVDWSSGRLRGLLLVTTLLAMAVATTAPTTTRS